jgi:hypothetical protein
MGSVGDAYDNALCESFFAALECELLARRRFTSQAEARMAVFSYIEGWYKSRPPPFRHPLFIPNRLRDADAQGNPNELSNKPSTEPGQLQLFAYVVARIVSEHK